jgi:SagB-type dehydrogenase family enzyme
MTKKINDSIIKNRYFLKDDLRMKINFSLTDQNKGLPPPPIEKPINKNQKIIKLPSIKNIDNLKEISLYKAIKERKSIRQYITKPLNLNEISFLLWATQGIKNNKKMQNPYRVVPSAGCRHSFETYIASMNILDLNEGIYRYLPIEHSLALETKKENLNDIMIQATLQQKFIGNASTVFIWSCIPYRMEWRYGLAAHRVIAFDIGHVCQNLYLAVQAISCGTCAIGAYNQQLIDQVLELDGNNEFVIYLASVGKIKKNE